MLLFASEDSQKKLKVSYCGRFSFVAKSILFGCETQTQSYNLVAVQRYWWLGGRKIQD